MSQELLINLSQLLREAALRNLCKQAIALYAGTKIELPTPALPQVKTQTLRDILTQAEPPEIVAQKPVNILIIGRTGAGKSSLINTLFQNELAAVDVLPSTDTIQNYNCCKTIGSLSRDYAASPSPIEDLHSYDSFLLLLKGQSNQKNR